MTPHPVRMTVEPAARMDRMHVLIRFVILVVLGTVSWSSLYWLLYLALPAVVALVVSQRGARRYLDEDAPRIAGAVRWIAAAYAYLALLTDALPTTRGGGPVELRIDTSGAPTAGSALLRLVTTLPALFVLAVVSLVAAFLWVIGAVAILVNERLPDVIAGFLAMALRYRIRVLAYHLSLVQEYPSLEDLPSAHVPHSGAA